VKKDTFLTKALKAWTKQKVSKRKKPQKAAFECSQPLGS